MTVEPLEDIQWYSGHAGVSGRTSMMRGVSLVHRREARDAQTLCGARVPFPLGNRRLTPGPRERRCSRCALIERTGGSMRFTTEKNAE